MQRRTFVTMVGATALTPLGVREAWARLSRGALNTMVAQELAESLSEPVPLGRRFATYAEAVRNGRPQRKERAIRRLLPQLERRVTRRRDRINPWPIDAQSIDYRHLLELGQLGRPKPDVFILNHGALLALSKANGFEERLQESRKVVFGLRGCVVVEAGSGPQWKVKLKEATPNHVDRRCVIGVWDRFDATVAVFEGSTVPDRVQVELHRRYARFAAKKTTTDPGIWRASLLPQGLYEYRLGTHLEGAPPELQQPRSLLLNRPAPVLRAQTSLSYTIDEYWDYARYAVGHNIHASMYLTDFLEFSSAGSQTVYGRYWPPGRRATGPWGHFRRALGIDDIQDTPDATPEVTEFPYLLTTGREARLHAQASRRADRSPFIRVRYGCRGPRALAAQQLLKDAGLLRSAVDGAFGRDSAVALLEYQKRQRLPRDGVITPSLAQRMNLRDW